MKKWFSKLLLTSLSLGILVFPFSIKAEVLNDDFDLSRLKGLKLGYYIGSFDPIHLGHQHVIEKALKSEYVDYVLIYLAPGGDQFKNRTDLALRQKMIASIYQEHPKVLLTYWTPKELQDKFTPLANDIDVVGIIGSDVVTETLMGPDKELSEKYRSVFMRGLPLKEKHYEDTVGALMALKANSFLVALRGEIDLSHVDEKIYDRSIRAFIPSKDNSSTEVRNAIKNQKPFEQFLSFPVQAIIKQEGLYGLSTNLNNALRDELLAMQELDQKARSKLLNIKTFSEELWKDVQEIDSKNGQKLKEIVSEYGWPGVSIIGLDGSSALWLLVQHQDQDVLFQKQCLNLLKTAVQEYEASPKSLAYLTDRVNMNENQPQIYGTQWVQQDGKFLLYTVEDREHLDHRRAEMGLSAIEEYKKQIQAAYQLSDEDFK
ncbi:MAG: adenylyltransferase/cytidyltransferase family protein [Verrucomicrobiota bacterium]|nr:adenylyltransferase/cytidyltransferase family protein [Verrucomicrobiota bacterium]